MLQDRTHQNVWPDWLNHEYWDQYQKELLDIILKEFGEEKFKELQSIPDQKNQLVKERRYEDTSGLLSREKELTSEFVPLHEKIQSGLDEKYKDIQKRLT
jgi:hypothetical protein